jgi:hypothetical protein
MRYSYAFGDHTWFLKKEVTSHHRLGLAWSWTYRSPGNTLLYVYKDAVWYIGMDACLGGELVCVLEFNEEIFKRFYRSYMPGTPMRLADMDFAMAERYIAKLIAKRAKESA